jgi:hypothetical protein
VLGVYLDVLAAGTVRVSDAIKVHRSADRERSTTSRPPADPSGPRLARPTTPVATERELAEEDAGRVEQGAGEESPSFTRGRTSILRCLTGVSCSHCVDHQPGDGALLVSDRAGVSR